MRYTILALLLPGPSVALAQRDLAEIPDPDPELERRSFQVAEGFEVNLFAADPLLACALVGMGVTSLSMAARAVRPVGAQLSRVSMDTCEAAAEAALGASDPMAGRDAVRALVH